MRNDPIHAAPTTELADTDDVIARAIAEPAHGTQPPAATIGQAFVQDLPWILALVGLVAFVISALGGYFR